MKQEENKGESEAAEILQIPPPPVPVSLNVCVFLF